MASLGSRPRQCLARHSGSSNIGKLVASLSDVQVRALLIEAAARDMHVSNMLLAAADQPLRQVESEAMAEQAAAAVHSLDHCSAAEQSRRAPSVAAALRTLVRRSEGFLSAGRGSACLESLMAIAYEAARPSLLPGAVWQSLHASGTWADIAFAMERAVHLCSTGECQGFQPELAALHRLLLGHGVHYLDDVLGALRLKIAASPGAASPRNL